MLPVRITGSDFTSPTGIALTIFTSTALPYNIYHGGEHQSILPWVAWAHTSVLRRSYKSLTLVARRALFLIFLHSLLGVRSNSTESSGEKVASVFSGGVSETNSHLFPKGTR